MVTSAPALYVGTIRHRRFSPRPHQFEYPLFMALLDIDRIPETMGRSAFTSCNRPNWASFNDRDHIGDPARPLRERVRDSAAASGVEFPDGPVSLLTHLRYGGYVFNPISIYYCHDRAGALRCVLADVRNTYGGRTSYWLRPGDDTSRRLRAVVPKRMYVSPFMAPDVDYEFVLTPPAERLVAHMNVSTVAPDQPSRLFDATLTLDRRPWTASTIRSVLIRYPLMTAKVIAAIYWEALRLRVKGLPVYPLPGEAPH